MSTSSEQKALITGMVDRVKNILMKPAAEWDKIDTEKATIPDLYKNYAVILALLPQIGMFVKGSVFGYSAMGVTVRVPFGTGLVHLIAGYILALVGVAVLAFIVDFITPKFGGIANQINAFKLCTYSMTAAWLAGFALLIPLVGPLLALAGFYSLYLFYLGVPKLMKTPVGNAGIMTVVAVVVNAIVMIVMSALIY